MSNIHLLSERLKNIIICKVTVALYCDAYKKETQNKKVHVCKYSNNECRFGAISRDRHRAQVLLMGIFIITI